MIKPDSLNKIHVKEIILVYIFIFLLSQFSLSCAGTVDVLIHIHILEKGVDEQILIFKHVDFIICKNRIKLLGKYYHQHIRSILLLSMNKCIRFIEILEYNVTNDLKSQQIFG